MTTAARLMHRRRWILLAALFAVQVAAFGAAPASAIMPQTAETRVGAFASTVGVLVGPPAAVSAVQGRVPWLPQPQFVVATGVAAEGVLPKLTGSIADSFEGGAYTAQTFKAGTTFYRAEGGGQGLGSFLGTVKPASAAEAGKLYNLAKWDNSAEVVSTYRLTADTTMYVGDVAGGSGVQALVPRGIDPASILQSLGTEPLP